MMTNELLTNGPQTLYVHEIRTPGCDKLFWDTSIFSQVNQSFVVDINASFTEVCHKIVVALAWRIFAPPMTE